MHQIFAIIQQFQRLIFEIQTCQTGHAPRQPPAPAGMYGAMDFENSKQSRALVTFLAVARYPPPSFRSGQSNRPLHLSLQSVNTGSVQFAASSRAVQEKDDIVPRDTIQVRIPPWRPLSHQSMLLTAVWCLVRVYWKGRRAYKGRQAKACKNSVRGRGCYCAVVRFTCGT